MPGVQLKGDVMVKPLPQLVVTGYLSVLDELYALTKGDQVAKLNTIADIGAGAEYSYIPRLSAFVQANNILNNKYERWRNYEAYGFNIFGGLRLKF
jgi:outer membrane receptor protein involved in Fe transport